MKPGGAHSHLQVLCCAENTGLRLHQPCIDEMPGAKTTLFEVGADFKVYSLFFCVPTGPCTMSSSALCRRFPGDYT